MRQDQSSEIDITETLDRRGPWYLLLRVHDHIWKDFGFPFRQRYEASKIPLLLWQECWTDEMAQRV